MGCAARTKASSSCGMDSVSSQSIENPDLHESLHVMLPTYNSLIERVRFLKGFLFKPILKVCNFHIQCYLSIFQLTCHLEHTTNLSRLEEYLVQAKAHQTEQREI